MGTAVYAEYQAPLACLSCTQVACVVGGPSALARLEIRSAVSPEHVEYIRRLVCPRCRGRLWVEEGAAALRLVRTAPTPEELARPRHGRAPGYKVVKQSPPPELPAPPAAVRASRVCIDCGGPVLVARRWRCAPCLATRQHLDARFLVILSDGEGHPTHELALALNCTRGYIRHLVKNAKRQGLTIVNKRREYHLLADDEAVS